MPIPVRAPNVNAVAERWIGTARRECLDHLLIIGPGHLRAVLGEFIDHYNCHRPHRALELSPPQPRPATKVADERIQRRDVVGGLIHEYHRAA